MVKPLARLGRRRPPSRPVCRRLCGHALRDCTLCNCALCDCALRDRARCAQIATMLLRMFALCAPVLCMFALCAPVLCVCWLRAFAPCALGRCVCAGVCLRTPCCSTSTSRRRRQLYIHHMYVCMYVCVHIYICTSSSVGACGAGLRSTGCLWTTAAALQEVRSIAAVALQGVSSAPRRSERRRHRLVCVRVTSLMIAHTRT